MDLIHNHFLGYCHFENGLCGLTSENSTEFQWSTGLGKTPSELTGPAFDHTTFTDKGTYLYINSSPDLSLNSYLKQELR